MMPRSAPSRLACPPSIAPTLAPARAGTPAIAWRAVLSLFVWLSACVPPLAAAQAAPGTAHPPALLPVPVAAPPLAISNAVTTAGTPAATQVCPPRGGPSGRASVGLVLSGGGARGYAHLGVLKVLDAHRIPVDCIAATSMGAVVGGLYASGMSADELIRRLGHVNLTDIAFDATERADLPQKRREDERLYMSGLTIGFGAQGFKVPAGLVQGNRLQALLADWTAGIPSNRSFDQLPVPFRAVATDLRSGQMVVLDHGSLPLAIRASMAVPGLFAPAEVDGHTLVDGGLVSNLPVDTAREMGASVVIAVDIASPLQPLDALASPTDVMQQMLGILIQQNVAAQHARLTRHDVLLEPKLGSLSFSDFQNAQQAIAAGEAAATAPLPALERYALSPADYAAYRAAHAAPPATPIRITAVRIHANGPVPQRVVAQALHVKPGDTYDPQSVSHDLLTLATSGNFDALTQQVVSDGDAHTLVIDAREKSWGPNFLLFGLGMSSSSTDEGGFRFHVGYRRPWLTASGLEFRADTTLGSDLQSAHVELRQPLTSTNALYLAPYAEFERRFSNIYWNDYKVTQYPQQTDRAGLDLGVPIARLGDFRIGIAYAHGSNSPTYNYPTELTADGTPLGQLFQSSSGHLLSARAKLLIDQLDDPLFPRSGYYLELRAERSILSSDHAQFTEVFAKTMAAAQYGRHSVNASLEGGKSLGGVSPVNLLDFTLGGFQHLAAYAADQLSGNSLVYGQLTYMNQVRSFNASPIKALYLGASAELGNVWTASNPVGSGPLKQSYSFFASLATSFGPVYVGVALAPGGLRNLYFQLGRTY